MATLNDIETAKQMKQLLYEAMVLYSQKRLTYEQLEQVFYDYLVQLPGHFFLDQDLKAIWEDKSIYGKGAYEVYTMTSYQATLRLLKERQSK